jgi:hypothetical protein
MLSWTLWICDELPNFFPQYLIYAQHVISITYIKIHIGDPSKFVSCGVYLEKRLLDEALCAVDNSDMPW